MKPTEPVFPIAAAGFAYERGIPVRLWIATHALQGLLSFRDYYGETREPALAALAHADALLKAYNDECEQK